MLLAIDVGNTNIKLGVYEGEALTHRWRLSTDRSKTGDELGLVLLRLLAAAELDPAGIQSVCVSSVVPTLNAALLYALRRYCRAKPLLVGPETDTGIVNGYEHPEQLGADRLVSAAGAYALYGGPLIVADCGTATKFGAVSAAGVFLGGVICPGIQMATDSLFRFTDKLPRIELVKPPTVIGRNTISGMQAGIIHGYAGMVQHLVGLMRSEMGTGARVVGTGGLIGLIAEESGAIDVINPDLILDGLRIIAARYWRGR